MRRLVSLLVLGTVVALSAGCAQAGGGTTRVAATPSWAEPSTVDTSASPSVDGSPSGTDASPSASPGTAGTSAAPKPPAPAPPPADSSLVGQLLAQVNSLRAANGLKPYTLASGLNASAHKHNLVMIGGCGLSHRCPGEADLGPRISAQGVSWHSLGENIGESGPNANTQAAILKAAKGLTMAMYNEKPPGDGHRKNILSSGFNRIGIDVMRDAKGTVWLTQDFAG